MKANTPKEDWKWQNGVVTASQSWWELGRQQAMEAALDFADMAVLGKEEKAFAIM